MKSDTGSSRLDFVLDTLGPIWAPGAEALKLRQDLNLHSLGDISAAAKRAGYELCYADLPTSVSGFALLIAGQPWIVINRAKSLQHQQHTVAHELGHHVLHVNAPREPQQPELPNTSLVEFQAHMFAAALVMWVTNDKDREDILRQNPESLAIPAISLFATLAIILGAVLAYLWSRLISPRLSGSGEGK